MTAKQKNTHLALLCASILLLGIGFYTAVVSYREAIPISYAKEATSRLNLNFGEKVIVPLTNQNHDYLYFQAGENDTYQLTFIGDTPSQSIIVNTGHWAGVRAEDGSVPVLHLIPEYIRKTPYSQVEIVAIRGDGDYYLQNLTTYDKIKGVEGQPYNLIDFEIKKYDITMSDESYQKIEQHRRDALDLGVLHTDADSFVSAKIMAGGENYSAGIRLKGDWTDHLLTHQWSYRVEISGDFAVWGLQKFSLQPLATRNGIWEYLLYEMYREEGGVAIRYDFADVTLNGVYLGVFAVEEFTEKRVIENSLNREGPIIKLNESPLWTQTSYYDGLTAPWGEYVVGSQNKTAQSVTLNRYAAYAITLINKYKQGEEQVENVFDVEKILQLSAVLDLFSAIHGRAEHNMRQYYNPVSARIEPIPFDEIASPGNTAIGFFSKPHTNYDPEEFYHKIMSDILADPENQKMSQEILFRLAENYPDFMARYQEQVEEYLITIWRDVPDFYMNMADLQPRAVQILSLSQPGNTLEPQIAFNFDQTAQVYTLTLKNPNPMAVYLTEIQVLSQDAMEYLPEQTVVGSGEVVIPLEFRPTQVDFSYHSYFAPEPRQASIALESAFFAVGHAYGEALTDDDSLHPPLISYLEDLSSTPHFMDYGIFTGDIKKNETGSEYAQLDGLMSQASLPYYAVPGNHDLVSQPHSSQYTGEEFFIQHYGNTFGHRLVDNHLMIHLDVYENLESNGSSIPQEQLDYVADLLEKHSDVPHIFLAMHQLMFLDFQQQDYGSFGPNSYVGYESNGENNFYSQLLPLFDHYAGQVYVIAGDTGAFANGNELYYQKDGKFHYLSNGVGGGENDTVLEFYLYSNGAVDIRLVPLNGQTSETLGHITSYQKGRFTQ